MTFTIYENIHENTDTMSIVKSLKNLYNYKRGGGKIPANSAIWRVCDESQDN